MRSTTTALLLAALAATAPLAAAGWGAKGMWEPDTRRDVADGWMTVEPDQAPGGRKVYFNGFSTHSAGYGAEVATSVNPNAAGAKTAYLTPSGRAVAMLGVWKDCNKDGYVGLGDQGLWEYRAELLLGDTSVCPAQALPDPIPRNWTPSHNDGEWVREFVPLGFDARAITTLSGKPIADANPYNLNDFGARVWMDWGFPESDVGTRCYAFPPEDSFHTTGAMVKFADCFTGFAATDLLTSLGQDFGLDGTPLGQLSFHDAPRRHEDSSSTLNRPNPWGDQSGGSMATAFDCSDPLVPEQRVPGTQYDVRVPRPSAAPGTDPQGTLGGTFNETENAFEDCDRSDGTTFDSDRLAYAAERSTSNSVDKKTKTSYTLRFNEGYRDQGTNNPQQLGRATAKDVGLRAWEVEGFWVSSSRLGEDRNPWVDRESLGPQQVTHATFYAFVSPEAASTHGLTLPAGSSEGKYGAEHCGAVPTGQWECDPAQWWITDDGSVEQYSTTAPVGGGQAWVAASVGDPFNLRDIDCYDYSAAGLREAGAHWGVLTGTACEAP